MTTAMTIDNNSNGDNNNDNGDNNERQRWWTTTVIGNDGDERWLRRWQCCKVVHVHELYDNGVQKKK